MKESEYVIRALASIVTPLFISLIVIIGLIKGCTDDTDPLDRNNYMAQQEYVDTFDVTDSCGNGFRIAYSTKNFVTKERLAEIKSRKHIRDAFRRLRDEAPAYFNNNMLDTDIYDFASFAKKYDCDDDIQIHCLFIAGVDKIRMYEDVNPSPLMKDCATWIDLNTEQGVQWINNMDIYNRSKTSNPIYRYWKCTSPLFEFSHTDERFSHFSESERIR